jgi:hypothetical protein
MGFLSVYSGVRRVDVGTSDRGYWIDLREHVSQGGREAAERTLAKIITGPDGKPQARPDITSYRQLMVLAHVVDWNLDDDDGKIWPIDLAHVKQIPGGEFDAIWTVVDELASPPSTEEQRQFPDGAVGSDPAEDEWTG